MTIWKSALEDALNKTRRNIDRFGDHFPHVGENGKYLLNDNTEWTNGFWSGILWLCYEYSGEDVYREAARSATDRFRDRLTAGTALEHHDIGFLYSLSAKAQWILEKDGAARALTLEAAETLMKRWRPRPGLLQAWGTEGDNENGGRIIIDCLMNLPLLYWASQVTGNPAYREVAAAQADKSRRFLVRGDDSSYHTFYFNQETGEAVRGGTHQGFEDGSTWTRGQAWGVYGFALSYRYTHNMSYLETSLRMARYFLERLPEDNVVYWDFDAPETPETNRDSSASAIAACGILELLEHLPGDNPNRAYLEDGVLRSMKGLVDRYSTRHRPDAEGLIERGSYSVRSGLSPDDYMIWGDYFYLEALMRLENRSKGYWYE
ncbi:glucuronyl hydrolase [Cohnella endophytica]|uniref:Glucuronyl hydrolase n=1 Tax=Cohnella endophytica TaxID=2419778 RepID=A0A494XTP3_9BACL|nr:glycoside hydrolase family 88 protein [Cohnella endophytica]RKP51469.1 glucuronyl hydrolase [Cohnella endophytica]